MAHVVKVNGRLLEELTPEEREAFEERGRRRAAEMFATGTPPHCSSDTALFSGDKLGLGPLEDDGIRAMYKREAEAVGVNTSAAQYMPELATYPGDPKAWVRDRGEMKSVIEERGWGAEDGYVKVKAEPKEPAARPTLNERIVDDRVRDRLLDTPLADPVAVREEVIATHAPQWSE